MIILGGIGHLRGALIGAFAKHWQLGLNIFIIASVALLSRGLVGVPGQWKERLIGLASRRPETAQAP